MGSLLTGTLHLSELLARSVSDCAQPIEVHAMAPSPRLLDPSDVCLGESGLPPTKNVDRGLAELKKLTPEDLLLFDEEAHIRDNPAIGATWFLRGHQKESPDDGPGRPGNR